MGVRRARCRRRRRRKSSASRLMRASPPIVPPTAPPITAARERGWLVLSAVGGSARVECAASAEDAPLGDWGPEPEDRVAEGVPSPDAPLEGLEVGESSELGGEDLVVVGELVELELWVTAAHTPSKKPRAVWTSPGEHAPCTQPNSAFCALPDRHRHARLLRETGEHSVCVLDRHPIAHPGGFWAAAKARTADTAASFIRLILFRL